MQPPRDRTLTVFLCVFAAIEFLGIATFVILHFASKP